MLSTVYEYFVVREATAPRKIGHARSFLGRAGTLVEKEILVDSFGRHQLSL